MQFLANYLHKVLGFQLRRVIGRKFEEFEETKKRNTMKFGLQGVAKSCNAKIAVVNGM